MKFHFTMEFNIPFFTLLPFESCENSLAEDTSERGMGSAVGDGIAGDAGFTLEMPFCSCKVFLIITENDI